MPEIVVVLLEDRLVVVGLVSEMVLLIKTTCRKSKEVVLTLKCRQYGEK